jgi:RES domain-containing protein
LSWGGSLKSATRFNNVGQPTIYLAEEENTSTKEVRFPKYLNATTLFGINVTALVLLDLSETQNLHKHQISKKMFRGPWKSFNNIKIKYYTQYLTDILRTLPIEGFLYESVQNPGCKCLCLFPEKMIKGSTLRVIGDYESIEDEDMTYEGDA